MKSEVVKSTLKYISLGRIVAVYGIKGWVKIYSHTCPKENILNYKRWIIHRNGFSEVVEIDQGCRHGKGVIAHIVGCNDRELATSYCNNEIMVSIDEMPAVADDEIYWHQLEELDVFSLSEIGGRLLLGKVSHMMQTGANAVLVVSPSKGSIDRRERLIPWLMVSVVLEVNPEKGFIQVDWDPDF
ncbi:MAG: ribosome maturation factor RimM [Candidatus Endonucleobacter sp. (ex Gigantidas childressi)]|nr:ribosome maturation factor RimM [Candidatus Endonucleobacter sp. (ex Gigantidas childressi)]